MPKTDSERVEERVEAEERARGVKEPLLELGCPGMGRVLARVWFSVL